VADADFFCQKSSWLLVADLFGDKKYYWLVADKDLSANFSFP
jgi:hypothetical protein